MIIPSVALQVTPFQFRNLIDFLTGRAPQKIPGALPRAGHLDRLLTSVATFVAICAVARLVFVVNVLGQNILRISARLHRPCQRPRRRPLRLDAHRRPAASVYRDMARLADPGEDGGRTAFTTSSSSQ